MIEGADQVEYPNVAASRNYPAGLLLNRLHGTGASRVFWIEE
jgi:hypothetical protein